MCISEISMIGMNNKVGGFEDPKYFSILTPSCPFPNIGIFLKMALRLTIFKQKFD